MALLYDTKKFGTSRLGLRVLIFAISVFAVLVCISLGTRIHRFARLFYSHSGIALTEESAGQSYLNSHDRLPAQIPKIVHQVFHNWVQPGNDALPADWAASRQQCININPKWDFKLWTENSSRDFIETEYPWFLKTYDGYRLPVQRVDALRYFALEHYGGIYIDLDQGCLKELTPLVHYPFWIADPGSGALNNNIIGSAPHHPFWTFVLHALYTDNYDYVFTFPTVHSSTGQWFITRAWENYHSLLPRSNGSALHDGRLYRLLLNDHSDSANLKFRDAIFTQERGGTWNEWDSAIFLWLGHRLLPTCLVSIFLVAMFLSWRCRSRCFRGQKFFGEKTFERIV